ncbi:tRNA pseudouridine(55) synthase TruB [Acaryochloris sp. CCMEE 5410]|uniref:tRNA pseudouridine(55) synthase TruB n=1 Tax=Acaryochloris sp. CCMEE 5410 TaxID=310037 RepID=UPI0002483DA4|nr:tRNA pseudouridine(55) synthase TruB [Acaryochloris sp. CCMEE 5410]KAI9134734.1 tRNA pseudouridine(55) synthase TruB [Acaryochloris sp. CCMEE 5410]
MLGFLNLHKPTGMTSHDCVGKVRRICGLKRVGHGGTLDPLATGVLPIALGPATRLLPYLPEQKAYQATIRFGLTTTTDDLAGDILSEQSANHLAQEVVEKALPQFLGSIEQRPPAYSAIQVQGQRLYDLARQGKNVTAPLRRVEVFDIQILDWQGGEKSELEVAIACGPGTYIRSIARDLGEVLGTGATLAQLTRTLSCGFALADSLTFETLAEQVQAGTFSPLEPSFSLQQPILHLPPAEAQRFCWGQKLPQDCADGMMQVHDTSNRFLGMGEIIDGLLKPKVVLPAQ